MSARPTARFWLVTAAAFAGVALAVSLGFWQLRRAHEKIALHDALVAQRALPAVSMQDLLESSNPTTRLLHRSTVLRGTWEVQRTIYLDNRQMRGIPGFYVVTPLHLSGSARTVLVQRGWVQRNFEKRDVLPHIDTPTGEVTVEGRIEMPPSKLYEFHGATEVGPIRQNLDLPAFRAATGLSLLDVSVVQTGAASEGLLRDWPEPASGVERHWGYMAQWWAIAALIVFLYVRFQLFALRRKAPHA